jgi:hypothetical protein
MEIEKVKKRREGEEMMVELVKGDIGGLEVPLRAILLQGSRQKAVAGRHALPYGVSGFCFSLASDVISLDYNYKLSLYNNYIVYRMIT